MSFFNKVFGGKKEATMTASEVIQNLHETEKMLTKKQDFLEKKIETELDFARRNGAKNKKGALQALKRKKRYEKQLQQIDGTLSTMEMQRVALEGANTNTAVLSSMKSAADALKTVQQNWNVDKIHDMMDDVADQQDITRDISDAIANPVAFGQDVDDDEFERELEELSLEDKDKDLLGIGTSTSKLPEVPTHDLKEPSVAVKEKKKAVPASLG